jgi:rare lipoprotein A
MDRVIAPKLLAVGLLASLVACAHRDAEPLHVHAPGSESVNGTGSNVRFSASGNPLPPPYQVGVATWYGQSFAGKKTSNGERFDPGAMTAAHRKLPFNTWVEVRRVDTGTSVRVRINDRGPWGSDRRVIDLSMHAAQILGYIEAGSAKVEIRVVNGPL